MMLTKTLVHPFSRYRQAHNLSQVKFAELIQVHRTCVVKIENGQRDRLDVDACLRVEQRTGGEITLKQLVEWRWPVKAKAGGSRSRAKRASAAT